MSRFLAEGAAHAVELPFPAFFFGAIAMGVFLLLAWVTWSYRDVANRHDHKSNDSKAHH
jgi:heme/copper-type cytochrome/quinol oxidase subunit 2